MSLAARPGSLTIYVNVSHSLLEEHGSHVKHRVYYGKEGESLQVRILVSLAGLWNVLLCEEKEMFSGLYCVDPSLVSTVV